MHPPGRKRLLSEEQLAIAVSVCLDCVTYSEHNECIKPEREQCQNDINYCRYVVFYFFYTRHLLTKT